LQRLSRRSSAPHAQNPARPPILPFRYGFRSQSGAIAMNAFVLAGLVKRRAEIAGDIEKAA
jgi:hypothetical protein